ncbi:helix-turn-helix domain-containing protein [Paenibacillus eucommiae]|uniref:AraC-like DNA-binding protein n=1 Tax=Paenibacillus eucommiae TaxID=1355755 RepID=A0ABS4IU17_9BACL|nr:helix-turn-helix domain-containing protein [Paenibacillus eucommiae]MBP1991067.1 AraC-like DNA-binding protein [Paenibacillus eucommiae]
MKSRYFYQLFLIILLISIPPLMLWNIYATKSFATQSTSLINEKNENELNRTGFLMNRTINQIKEMAISGLNVDIVGDPSDPSIVDRLNTMDKLSKLVASNEYLQSVYLYNALDGSMLASDYGIVFQLDRSGYRWIKQHIQNMAINKDLQMTNTRMNKKENTYTVSLVLNIHAIKQRHQYLIYNIDIEKLYRDFFSRLNVDSTIYNYYIVNQQDEVIFPLPPEASDSYASDQSIQYVKMKSERYVSTTRYRLPGLQWTLVGEVDTRALYQGVDTFKKRMYFLTVVIVVALAGLVFIGSRQLYKPILYLTKRFRQGWQQELVDVRQAVREDEFEFLHSTFDHMVDTYTELNQRLANSQNLLNRTQLYYIIKSRNQTADYAGIGKAFQLEGSFVVFIFKLNVKAEWSHEMLREDLEKRFAISEHCEIFSDEQECFAVIQLPDEDLNGLLVRVLLLMDDEMLQRTSISVGNVYQDLSQLHESYTEAKYAYQVGRMYDTEEHFYCFNKLPMDYHKPVMEELSMDVLEHAIRQQQMDAYAAMLNRLFRDDTGIMEYNTNFYMVLSMLRRMHDQEEVSFLHEVNELIANNSIMNNVTLKSFFMDQFKLFAQDSKSAASEKDQYMKRIEHYVEVNYPVNFSLDDISCDVGISKQYICQLVKQQYNITFIDYLNQYRIDQAKLILERGPMKISEVYAKVGFNSYSYFSKVFKQYTGLVPSEYRELSMSRERTTS